MDIPSLFMIPSAVSSGKVHSVFPNSTDADFQFNRDSDATRVNSEGLIERVGYYGSEEITNGNFDTDTSSWFGDSGASLTWQSNKSVLVATTDDATFGIAQGSVLTSGKTYRVLFRFKPNNTTTFRVRLGASGSGQFSTTSFTLNEWNDVDFVGVANGTTFEIGTVGGSISNFYLDNVSVKEITGDRARLNYEIEGGLVNTKPSLLLEPQSTNLVTYSEDFSQSYWVKSGASVTSGFVSPDGTNNAYKLVEDSSNSRHFINSTEFSTPDTVYSSSVFVKPNGRNKIALRENAQTGNYASFNLSNGTLIATNGVSASIELMFNGWYRINYQITSGASIILGFELLSDSYTSGDPNSNPYQGDGLSGIYIFGAQVESQSYATSYIPTNGSTQTRAAETCNGAGTSSILPSEEGILYAEIAALANDSTLRVITLGDNSSSNAVSIQLGNPNQITLYVNSGGVNQCAIVASVTTLAYNKCAIRYKQNNFSAYVNGTKVGVDTSGSTFASGALNRINFDIGYSSTSAFYGKIRDIRVYNTKEMTDSEVDILLTKITS